MHRALVSGITGHLGAEVARQLASNNVQVHGLTRQTTASSTTTRSNGSPRLHRIDGSTETLIEILDAVRPDVVFHIAGASRREHQPADIEPFIAGNVKFGAQLLEAMKCSDCRRFITAGSYLQHCDTSAYRAFNLYAATKQAFEELLAYYVDAFGFVAARLTLADIYSERDTRRKLLTDIAMAWSTGRPLELRDSDARVDLVHVEDAAAAFLKTAELLERDRSRSGAVDRYSVTSGRDSSISELVRLFELIGGGKVRIQPLQAQSGAHVFRPWRGDVVPGWTPGVSIEEGVRRIVCMSHA